MTSKELKILATLPELIRVLRKFNAEAEEIRALMGSSQTPVADSPAVTVRHAVPVVVGESDVKRERREFLASIRNSPQRAEKLAQFAHDQSTPSKPDNLDKDYEEALG